MSKTSAETGVTTHRNMRKIRERFFYETTERVEFRVAFIMILTAHASIANAVYIKMSKMNPNPWSFHAPNPPPGQQRNGLLIIGQL